MPTIIRQIGVQGPYYHIGKCEYRSYAIILANVSIEAIQSYR